MPCRDYPSNTWADPTSSYEYLKLKDRTDMLARIACKALTELENQGTGDFLLLRDTEVREWWTKHKEDDRKARLCEERAKKRKQK